MRDTDKEKAIQRDVEKKTIWDVEEALQIPLYDPDDDNPPELVRLKSGAIFSTVEKHIVGMSAGGLNKGFTPGPDGTGKAAVEKRFDDNSDAFIQGLAEKLLDDEPIEIDPNKLRARTARALGRKTGELLKGTKNSRGYAEMLNVVIKFGHFSPNQLDVEMNRPPAPPALPSPEMMQFFTKLLDSLDAEKARIDVIEGKVKDVEEK